METTTNPIAAESGTPEKPKLRNLSRRERRFVEEYLVDVNAGAAAQRAGYAKPKEKATEGKVSASARTAGWRLLRDPAIEAAIRRGMEELSERVQVNAARVIQELTEIGLGPGEGAAKVRALELIGRHLGMFADNPSVALTVNVNPQAARERIDRRLASLAQRN